MIKDKFCTLRLMKAVCFCSLFCVGWLSGQPFAVHAQHGEFSCDPFLEDCVNSGAGDVVKCDPIFDDNCHSQQVDGNESCDPFLPMEPTVCQNKEDFSQYTKEDWQKLTYHLAGIDPSQWDTNQGINHNLESIRKVYKFYGRLFVENQDLFLWAGWAKAGASVFIGNFEHLGSLSKMDDHIAPMDITGGGAAASMSASMMKRGSRDIGKRFMEMQKAIYLDLAWQHVAYHGGGIAAMEAAFDRGDFGKGKLKGEDVSEMTINAWRDIANDAVDRDRVWWGNRIILRREQEYIVQSGWDDIRNGEFGAIAAQVASWSAAGPIPGATEFSEFVPDGDITNFSDRWKWLMNELELWHLAGPEKRRSLADVQ